MGAHDSGDPKVRRKPGRVPTSCAECRRLKLRCDRSVPCGMCVKRSCPSICPDGCLTSGKGNRMILANTEELHERIDQLSARIRDLEAALRTLQATVSEDPHPLLRLGPLVAPSPGQSRLQHEPFLSMPPFISSAVSAKDEEDSIVDAFGTLSIGPRGEAHFLGTTARSEYLIHVLRKSQPINNLAFPRLPPKVVEIALSEDEVPANQQMGQDIFALLPPLSEAFRLCEIYLSHGKYSYLPIPRTELFDNILASVYRADSFSECSPHILSLLFIIFALGSFFDPTRPPYCIEAQEFYILSRASLSYTCPIRETTLFAIQATIHLVQYLELCDYESLPSDTSWMFIGVAVRLGHSIGLHLNSARWNLNAEDTQKRSRIFWQLFFLDTWTSFGVGRPPGMSLAYNDCALPKDEEVINEKGQNEMGYHMWNWQYTVLMHSVMSTAFGAKMPPYTTIVDLDRKVRDFPVPEHLRPRCHAEDPAPEYFVYMQRWWVLSCKETTLLHLHRSYFAQALRDRPDDLMKHKYTASVMVAYRSAWRIIEGLAVTYKSVPHLISRMSLAWSQALSAAIVMCLLVTRAPTSSLTASSLAELDVVVGLFEEAAPDCRAAANNLESVQKLCRKAHDAIDISQPQESTTISPAELDRLGGKTHLISGCSPIFINRTACARPPSCSSSSSESSGVMDFFVATPPDLEENMHPTIVQDMRTFDLGAPAFNHIFDFPADTTSQPMPDIQFANQALFDMSQSSLAATFSPGPPMLDATWQSFVEQLGF